MGNRPNINISITMTFHIRALITALLLLLTAQSCTFIDDDRSDCEDTYSLNYELKVVSNINLQLSEQLQVSTGSMTLKALNNYFSPIMQPATSEARLGFFPTDGDAPIYYSLHTEGRRTALGISIPADNYRHIAVIGQADPSIFLTDTTMAATVRLTRFLNDTVDSHNHAILAGTLDMDVLGNVNQSWEVNLYPADASVSVVLKKNPMVRRTRVFLADLATSFTPNDSTWHWDHNSLVRTDAIDVPGTDSVAYCGIAFPSRADSQVAAKWGRGITAKNVGKGTESPSNDAVWRIIVLNDMPGGSVTRTVLYVRKPLRAGDVRVIRVHVNDDGGVDTGNSNVGASVTLDWKKGGEYNPEI